MLRTLLRALRQSISCPQCGEFYDSYSNAACPNCGNGSYHAA